MAWTSCDEIAFCARRIFRATLGHVELLHEIGKPCGVFLLDLLRSLHFPGRALQLFLGQLALQLSLVFHRSP